MKKRSGVREKILKVFAASLLLMMVLSLNAFASIGSGTQYVPKGSAFRTAEFGITRSCKYNYVTVYAASVYPATVNTTDNYTKCKTKLSKSIESIDTTLSDVTTCTEGIYTYVTIKNGYLDVTSLDMKFAGNNPNYDAYISYSYNGN